MYAIVNIAGQQFKVSENKPVYVHRLNAKEGDSITFDQVLVVGGNGSVKVGAPVVSGASVSAKVISHVKGDKVLIFKKKRRKGYQKLNGHRQSFTKIQVDKISI
jgi:large subunit ribosomal protein L21